MIVRRERSTQRVAATLFVAVQLLFAPVASAGDPTSLSGSVIAAETRLPLAGAVVRLVDPDSGELFSSAQTDGEGRFQIVGLPPSTYMLGVESEGGLFTSQTPVSLEPGQGRSVQVAIHQLEQPGPDQKKKKKGGGSPWDNPLTATLIVLGAAIVVGVIIDELVEDEPATASPSGP